jgi:hypothetical protein
MLLGEWQRFYKVECYQVNNRDLTRHVEDGSLVGKIKTFHELIFKLLLEGKKT